MDNAYLGTIFHRRLYGKSCRSHRDHNWCRLFRSRILEDLVFETNITSQLFYYLFDNTGNIRTFFSGSYFKTMSMKVALLADSTKWAVWPRLGIKIFWISFKPRVPSNACKTGVDARSVICARSDTSVYFSLLVAPQPASLPVLSVKARSWSPHRYYHYSQQFQGCLTLLGPMRLLFHFGSASRLRVSAASSLVPYSTFAKKSSSGFMDPLIISRLYCSEPPLLSQSHFSNIIWLALTSLVFALQQDGLNRGLVWHLPRPPRKLLYFVCNSTAIIVCCRGFENYRSAFVAYRKKICTFQRCFDNVVIRFTFCLNNSG